MKRWLNFSQLAWGSNRDKSRAGYTITEVMIVLAISAGLFFTVALLLQGRQKAAQYTQAIRDFEGRIQSMASDVQKGFFNSAFDCIAGPTGPIIQESSINGPGKNEGCVFMGKVMQKAADGDSDRVEILTMVGRRTVQKDAAKVVAETLEDAASIPVDHEDITVSVGLNWGLEISRMTDINTDTPIDRFAFMTNPGGDGKLTSVVLYYLTGGAADPTAYRRAEKGIRICMTGPTGQPGMVTVGAAGDQLSTNVEIGNEICSV